MAMLAPVPHNYFSMVDEPIEVFESSMERLILTEVFCGVLFGHCLVITCMLPETQKEPRTYTFGFSIGFFTVAIVCDIARRLLKIQQANARVMNEREPLVLGFFPPPQPILSMSDVSDP
jgi:hypothetical protein